MQSQNFSGDDTPHPTEAPTVLGIRHQFPLESLAFPLFWFYKTTTDAKSLSGNIIWQKCC